MHIVTALHEQRRPSFQKKGSLESIAILYTKVTLDPQSARRTSQATHRYDCQRVLPQNSTTFTSALDFRKITYLDIPRLIATFGDAWSSKSTLSPTMNRGIYRTIDASPKGFTNRNCQDPSDILHLAAFPPTWRAIRKSEEQLQDENAVVAHSYISYSGHCSV